MFKHISVAVLALLGVGALAALMLAGSGGSVPANYSCTGPRIVELDLSSQNRSETAVETAVEVMSAQILGAAICAEDLTLLGVAAGNQVLLEPEVPFLEDLRMPNERARANVVGGRAAEVRHAVASELAELYARHEAVDTTSIPALFQAAADHSESEQATRVVILTTGVHIQGDLTLNRPLTEGEGRELAAGLHWPQFGGKATVVMLGLTKMDGDTPAPGDLWPREVIAFNEAACAASGAKVCRLYQVAALERVLL